MVRVYTKSLFFYGFLLFTPTVTSIRIHNRYSLGDKFTYAENKTSTIVNLFTGKKKVKQEETVYTEHIVKLNDPLINGSAEIDKTYSFVRFTPSNERVERLLLSQHIRENFQDVVKSSGYQYSVGDRWADKVLTSLDTYTTVTHIYESDDYGTEVITFDVEVIGTIPALSYKITAHYWTTKDVDVETGIILYEKTIRRFTFIDERQTDITVKKLIKRATDIYEL